MNLGADDVGVVWLATIEKRRDERLFLYVRRT